MNCFPPAADAAEDEAALLDRNGTRIFRVGYIRVDRYEKEKKKERRKCNELMYFPGCHSAEEVEHACALYIYQFVTSPQITNYLCSIFVIQWIQVFRDGNE